MEQNQSFGAYIREKRKERNLTQKSFARLLFVSESAVSKWERNKAYPDITLIPKICEVLEITERELLTASEDTGTRRIEKMLLRYQLTKKILFIVLSGMYAAAIVTCFICNLAVEGTLSWFFIVLTAILLASTVTILPLSSLPKKALMTLFGFLGALILLLFTCNLYTGGDWFLIATVSVLFGFSLIFTPLVLKSAPLPGSVLKHKTLLSFALDTVLLLLLIVVCGFFIGEKGFFEVAFPIALVCLPLPWSYMLLIRYAKWNGFLKTAVCLFIADGYMFFINGFIDRLLGIAPFKIGFAFDLTVWNLDTVSDNSNFIIFLIILLTAFVFLALGIAKSFKHQKENR